MRKRILRAVCAAAVLTMALSFAGCGSEESKKDNDTKQEETVKDEETDDTEEAASSLEDYVNSEIMQTELESLKTSLSDSGMSIDITADGNALVYTYKYEQLARADFDDASVNALKDGLAAESATFESVAESLKTVTDEENPIVRIKYISSDDQVIYEQEFAAK